MQLTDLKPAAGSNKDRKRKGRGIGSGRGRTAGRGQKGQKSRSGGGKGPVFEGGQVPWYRRVPHIRGISNRSMSTRIFRKEYEILNVEKLNVFDAGAEVTPETLIEKGLVKRNYKDGIKILGKGEINVPLKVFAHEFSKSACEKILASGGKIEVI